jgi:hypothetical protein
VSNEELVRFAMNDLRNRAAKLGANYIQHDSPQLGVAGGDGGSTTSTATVSGTAYLCSDEARNGNGSAEKAPIALAEPEQKKQPRKKRLMATPIGAGGFKLGAKLEDAQRICTDAGHAWKLDADRAHCSGVAASVGETAETWLVTCGATICGIDVLVVPETGKLADTESRFRKALEKKYGMPRVRPEEMSEACRAA